MANDVSYFKVQGDNTTYSFNDADLESSFATLNNKVGSTSMGTTATTVTGAVKEHSDKIGTSSMGTTATTLTGAIAEHEGDISTLNSNMSACVSLYHGTLNTVDGTAALSEDATHFRYLLFVFKTNAEYATQLVPVAFVTNRLTVNQTMMTSSTSGQVTYPIAYNGSINVAFTSNTQLKCTMNVYNNANLKVSLCDVYGVQRVSS